MPVHNSASFLPDTLAALLAERDVALEVIAVNDGSSDDSLSMLEELARNDARLVVIDQPNQGPSVARNTGLRVARGEWIAFADADDWISPGTLRNWLRRATTHRLDVLIGNGYRFTDHPGQPTKGPLLRRQPWDAVMSGPDWIVRCSDHEEWPHYVWLQFIRRSLIQRHGLRFAPKLLHEDILWTLQIALAARRVGFDRHPAYGYRSNPASVVNSPSQAALGRRAHSYVDIMKALVDVALATKGNAALHRALLRHAHVEFRYFDKLLRDRITQPRLRRELAHRLHQAGLWRHLSRGARRVGHYRRLAHCYLATALMRRQRPMK
ncbi:glycosyltransferase [Bordetella flabilis]|uniref:Glycosyltransferase 2-like domain-containing protein n=1 Tax=Bordetella flabilis TaxID=463014 RepID=A0A193GIE6_9BORD|nr:glycosyltransferase [Bordetella flabilis]ANN79842.1 hypothetical protein BAU07_24420 [Bordetella flabilis]